MKNSLKGRMDHDKGGRGLLKAQVPGIKIQVFSGKNCTRAEASQDLFHAYALLVVIHTYARGKGFSLLKRDLCSYSVFKKHCHFSASLIPPPLPRQLVPLLTSQKPSERISIVYC